MTFTDPAGAEPQPDRIDRIQAEWVRERPDVDVGPQGVIGRLHRVARLLTEELALVYARHSLGEGDFDVLATLRRAGAPYERAAGELAHHTMVTTGAMTKRVDRLIEAGLVTRRRAGTDGRGRVIGLTEAGLTLIDAAFTDHMRNEHRLMAMLADGEADALRDGLRTWLARLEQPDARGPRSEA